jgi:DNA-binding transcriptional LysR family regulator
MDLVRWMETFVSVASLRSLSEAARGQNLTPSAVSKQLAALEEHLGVTLISRTTRGLSLTSAGQTFLPRAIKIVDEISNALHDARGSSLTPRGTLSVGAPVAFGRLHVGPAIPKFLQKYPDVSINFGLFDRQVDPVLSGIDVSFRMGHLRDSSFVAAKLATTRRVLCASPEYLAKRGRPASPDDLAQHDCLVHTVYTARNVWYFRRKNEIRSVLVKGRLGANNSEALFQAARQGLGIALLGSWAVAEEIKSGTLEPLLPGWSGELTREPRHLYLVYQRTAQASQITRAFVDFMRDHVGSPPYWDRQV